jgi:O-antigen ligase
MKNIFNNVVTFLDAKSSLLLLNLNRFFLSTETTDLNKPYLQKIIVYILGLLLFSIPLIKTDLVYHQYSFPKFVVLLVGATTLFALLCSYCVSRASLFPSDSKFSWLMVTYALLVAISTIFAINPVISLQGSFARQMGLITYLCFFASFFAVVITIEKDKKYFEFLIKVMCFTGGLVSLYGIAQVFGLITIPYPKETIIQIEKQVVRVNATLGHPDFTGNYLLFITYITVVIALIRNEWKWKLLAIVASSLSVISILFTGTRGAWLGLLAGGGVLLFFIFWERQTLFAASFNKTILKFAACITVGLGFLFTFIAFTSWGAPVRARFLAFSKEGYTGAGRTVLWKYTLDLFPHYWLTGWGLDSFRFAPLSYKTLEFAKLIKGFNQEDPHNAYLSSLVSIGLFGTIIYFLLIILALLYFLDAIKLASEKNDKWLGIGLLASFSGVLVHNIFIFHNVVTGFYFFVFLGLSYCWRQIMMAQKNPTTLLNTNKKQKKQTQTINNKVWAFRTIIGLPLIAAIFYSLMLTIADYSINECKQAANDSNYKLTVYYGREAAEMPLYQSDFHGLFAVELSRFLTKPNFNYEEIFKSAIYHAEKLTVNTTKAEASFIFLATLTMSVGDFKTAEAALINSGKVDPLNPNLSLAWGKYYLKQNDIDKALEQLIIARKQGAPHLLQRRFAKEILSQVAKMPDKDYIREKIFLVYRKFRKAYQAKPTP